MVAQNGEEVWYYRRPSKKDSEPKEKSTRKQKSKEKRALEAGLKPKSYEEIAATLTKCTVNLGRQLSKEDIAREKAKLKRESKVKAIQEKIKTMPGIFFFLKIV